MGEVKEKNMNCVTKLIRKIRAYFIGKERNRDGQISFKEGISSLKYHYRNLHEWTPRLFYLGILRFVPDTLIPVFAIVLPTLVVKGLEEKWEVNKFIFFIVGLMLLMLIFNLVNAKIQSILESEKDNYRFRYLSLLCDKKMDVDYDVLESQDFQNKQKYAFHWIVEWSEPMEKCISSPGVLASCIVGILAYGIALAKQSTIIMILIIISVAINIKMQSDAIEYEDSMWSKNVKERRKMGYINNQAMDFAVGKDIRLYGMQNWLIKMYRKYLKASEEYIAKIQWKYCVVTGTNAIMVFFRDCAAYVYLIYEIVNGRLTVSDFVLYTSLVAGFSIWIRKAIEEIQWLVRGAYAFHSVIECFGVKNKWNNNSGAKKSEDNSTKLKSIEFRDVSFYYDGREKPTISHLNLKIDDNEKVALVGLNGAGKTTLVKLLCGFYKPTEGEILVNGVPIQEYERDDYYSMISAVFQDAQILPVSIAENISSQPKENTDYKRVKECLKLSGLNEKTDKLVDGENTFLVRELSSEAIDLSGGEKQKLLLSRALYKRSQIIVLDEPTAALDPIAEYEVYSGFNEMIGNKTAIYISHRLSSCRFCNDIAVFNDGNAIQRGSHLDLLKEDGLYSKMWNAQAQYYSDSINNSVPNM